MNLGRPPDSRIGNVVPLFSLLDVPGLGGATKHARYNLQQVFSDQCRAAVPLLGFNQMDFSVLDSGQTMPERAS
ncbi:hypothetical protein [Brevibacillus reuszeri]|uniref:hypothetical protein n=1 Tax=Brevibacillus reuszeri TaxID=54915 RepID=UPI000AB12630|nr:hypothetical protein [Brevibacillus reuszeri]MED1859088.1 hypothetical protein [Brevibacillus reuszeri]